MEVSSTDTAESDSFFAVNTIAESVNESLCESDELVPLKPSSPIFLVLFTDFLNPFSLFLCSIATTATVGLLYILLLIIHVSICRHVSHSFFGFVFLTSIEMMLTIIILLFAIFSEDNPSDIRSAKIIGISFQDRSLALASTIISVIFQAISLRFVRMTSVESYKQKRSNVYSNSYFTYFVDVIYSFSIALIASTTISDLFFIILIYYTYSNLSLIFCGKEIMCKVIKIFFTLYSLVYAFFQFFMLSYPGSLVAPKSDNIWFAFIGSEKDKNVCLIFSIYLAWTSIIILTNLEARSKNTVPIIFFLNHVTNILIDILFVCIFFFASYFPNYLTVLYLIIMFFSTFCHRQIISRFFFPFLGFIFIISFLIIALTQYGKFGHPEDNGTEQYYSFLKLFGFFKYENSNRFTFCCAGFMIFASFGQIGRIKFATSYHSKRKTNFDIHRDQNSSETQDRSFKIYFLKFEYYLFKFLKILHKTFYQLLMYLSLPACIVVGIYSGLFKDKCSFQILSFLSMLIVILFLYYRWSFQILKFISGIIIIICAFYKSSDSYECRGQEKCLFFGYFKDIEISGFCPSPKETLISYYWPVCVVFILSLFLACDEEYLRTDYPPIIIVFLYFTVSICDLIYVFKYTISIFTIFYFFIGCFIIAFQFLEWNGMRTFMIMLNFIAVSVQLSIYIIVRNDDMRNFFMSHVSSKIININIMTSGDSEIILLAFMLFFSSIVFHGPQKIKLNKFVKNIIQFIRQINYYLYFDLSSLFLFGLSIANDYPSFIKFLFLLSLTLTSISPRFFFKCRIVFVFVFAIFIITQFVFHIFTSKENEKFYNTFIYVGFYFSKDDDVFDNHKKNISIGWEFSFLIVSLLNSPSLTSFTLADDFEKKKIIQVFRSLCACGQYLLQSFTKVVMYVCASYNETIFSWFLLFAMIQSAISPHFFYKAAPFILFFIYLYLLAQYLLYLGFPDSIIHRDWKDPIDLINPKYRDRVDKWFEFLGIYHVKVSSLITTYASAVSLAIYLHFYKVQVDYQYRFDSLPSFIKYIVELIVQNIFKICITFILIFAALSKKPDGLFLFVLGSVFFAATLLFDYNLISTRSIIQSVIYSISFLRILSRLPVFVDTKKSNFVIRLFDLPLRGYSASSVYWIVMFALIQILVQIQSSDLYIQLSKKKSKRLAYRFIRERQLKIIEKLDQDILLCKRRQEINFLITNRNENLQQEMNETQEQLYLIDKNDTEDLFESLSSSDNENNNNNNDNNNNNGSIINISNNNNNNSNRNIINDEFVSIFNYDSNSVSDGTLFQNDDMISVPRKNKWYHRFYFFLIEPQIIRLTRILSTSLPVNLEVGINVLTLESLTILMRRCLSHYEKNKEFILEEREKQFLMALPPSFAYHFSSIYHLIDYQPLFDHKPIELLVRYLCLFIRNLSLPILVLISTIYLFLKPYIFSIVIFAYVICIFCSLDFNEFPNVYRIFFIFVIVILGLQASANTDLIYERLKTIQSSLTNIQSSISALSLIGLEPNSSSAIEICLFVSCIYFISQQIDTFRLYSSAYSFEKLSYLTGFPAEFCYGIMDDPVHNLAMKVPQTRSFIKTIKHQMNRVWLQSTVHHNFILFINTISFILLISTWLNWESSSRYVFNKDSFSRSVTVFFSIAMIADVVFQLSVYFCCLNNLYFALFWIEFVWLLYNLSIIFFYLRSSGDSLDKTSEFYVFIRVLQHIIAAHICFIGRTNISYRMHDFAKEWRIILFSNKFLRFFPFVFEIQSMLLWIGRNTLINFTDFLVVRTMEVHLEIAICKKIEKRNQIQSGSKPKLKFRILGGIFYLFLFVFAAFIPLFFWYNSDSDYVENEVVFARIQAGISSLPPFYDTIGNIRLLTRNEMRILANNSNKKVHSLLSQPKNTLCLVDFPLFSNSPFSMSRTAFENFARSVISSNSNQNSSSSGFYKFYVKYKFYLQRSATVTGKKKCDYTIESDFLDQSQLNNTLNVISSFFLLNNFSYSNRISPFEGGIFSDEEFRSFFNGEELSTTILCNFLLSHVFYVVPTSSVKPLFSNLASKFDFLIDGDSFSINISSYDDISFLNSTSAYRLMISSSHVVDGLNAQSFYKLSGSGGFNGIYILVMIVLGVSIREVVFKKADGVWRNRIQKPFILYRMIIAINMFKNAKDPKGERDMCNKFIITLRGQTKGVIDKKDDTNENKEKTE